MHQLPNEILIAVIEYCIDPRDPHTTLVQLLRLSSVSRVLRDCCTSDKLWKAPVGGFLGRHFIHDVPSDHLFEFYTQLLATAAQVNAILADKDQALESRLSTVAQSHNRLALQLICEKRHRPTADWQTTFLAHCAIRAIDTSYSIRRLAELAKSDGRPARIGELVVEMLSLDSHYRLPRHRHNLHTRVLVAEGRLFPYGTTEFLRLNVAMRIRILIASMHTEMASRDRLPVYSVVDSGTLDEFGNLVEITPTVMAGMFLYYSRFCGLDAWPMVFSNGSVYIGVRDSERAADDDRTQDRFLQFERINNTMVTREVMQRRPGVPGHEPDWDKPCTMAQFVQAMIQSAQENMPERFQDLAAHYVENAHVCESVESSVRILILTLLFSSDYHQNVVSVYMLTSLLSRYWYHLPTIYDAIMDLFPEYTKDMVQSNRQALSHRLASVERKTDGQDQDQAQAQDQDQDQARGPFSIPLGQAVSIDNVSGVVLHRGIGLEVYDHYSIEPEYALRKRQADLGNQQLNYLVYIPAQADTHSPRLRVFAQHELAPCRNHSQLVRWLQDSYAGQYISGISSAGIFLV